MVNFNETSWITSDGMIWLQILNMESAIDIMLRNSFELYVVNLEDESESYLYDLPEDDIEERIRQVMQGKYSSEIICIPVGKMENIAPNVFRNKFNK